MEDIFNTLEEDHPVPNELQPHLARTRIPSTIPLTSQSTVKVVRMFKPKSEVLGEAIKI